MKILIPDNIDKINYFIFDFFIWFIFNIISYFILAIILFLGYIPNREIQSKYSDFVFKLLEVIILSVAMLSAWLRISFNSSNSTSGSILKRTENRLEQIFVYSYS